MVLVQHAARLGDVDAGPASPCSRAARSACRDSRAACRARPRPRASAPAGAAPCWPAARTSSGMPASAIAFFRSSTSAAVPSSSPSSFRIVASCSRSRCLALALLQRAAGGLAQLARQAQHAQALVQELQHPVEPAAESSKVSSTSCFSAGLMSMVPATRSASWPAELDAADRVGELARRLRQQLDRLQRPLAQQHEARLDLGAACPRARRPARSGRPGTGGRRRTPGSGSAAGPGRSDDGCRPARSRSAARWPWCRCDAGRAAPGPRPPPRAAGRCRSAARRARRPGRRRSSAGAPWSPAPPCRGTGRGCAPAPAAARRPAGSSCPRARCRYRVGRPSALSGSDELAQGQGEAALGQLAPDQLVAARRQVDPPLEACRRASPGAGSPPHRAAPAACARRSPAAHGPRCRPRPAQA